MITQSVDPRYGLNPHETYWIYSATDIDQLIRSIESGNHDAAQRILKERRFPLGFQSDK